MSTTTTTTTVFGRGHRLARLAAKLGVKLHPKNGGYDDYDGSVSWGEWPVPVPGTPVRFSPEPGVWVWAVWYNPDPAPDLRRTAKSPRRARRDAAMAEWKPAGIPGYRIGWIGWWKQAAGNRDAYRRQGIPESEIGRLAGINIGRSIPAPRLP